MSPRERKQDMPATVLQIKEQNKNTAAYKTVEILYGFIIVTLLGGIIISGLDFQQKLIFSNIAINWMLIPPVMSLIFLAFTFFTFYSNIVVLVKDSLAGEVLMVSLAFGFWICSVMTLCRSVYWPMFATLTLFIPFVKNLHLGVRLWKESGCSPSSGKTEQPRHPLESNFFRWSFISLGYIALAAIITITAFSFGRPNSLAEIMIANVMLFILVSAFCIINLRYFSKEKLLEIEMEIDRYLLYIGTSKKNTATENPADLLR